MSARGVIIGHVTASITEGVDVLDAPSTGGPITVQASSASTMADDTLSSASTVAVTKSATVAVTEAADTLTTVTLTSSTRTATFTPTESPDTSASAAAITAFPQRTAALAQTDANDTVATAGQLGALITLNGALQTAAGTEAGDTMASAAGPLALTVNGTLTPGTEANDTLTSVTQTDNVINGVAIGSVGTGTLTNFKLLAGDDFIGPPKLWTVHKPFNTRTYANYHFNGNRGQQEGATNGLDMNVDPDWMGPRSELPGGTTVNPISVANSVLTITMAKPTDPTLISILPTTFNTAVGNVGGKPALQGAHLRTGAYFQYSGKGDWCCEAVFEVAAGAAIGYWLGPWETGLAAWPDHGEYDFGETTTNISTGVKTYDTGLHISDVDGGPDVGTTPLTLVDIPNDRPIWVRAIKTATKIEQYDDVAVQGTLALRNTYTNSTRVARIRGGHHMRFDAGCNLSWHGGTFTPSQWPKTVKYHWWRCWGPSSGRDWVAPTDLGVTLLAQGAAWSYTMPAASGLYGAVPDYEEVVYTVDGMDSPGINGRNVNIQRDTTVTPPIVFRTLGGVTYTPTTRTWAGTFPAGEGGRTGLQMVGSFNAGGACRMAYKWFEVAPAVQPSLFADFTITQGTPIATKTIVYADFHSGNLGPHVYTASFSSGGAGLSISGNGTATVTISGTPTDIADAVISIVCTNVKGQSTTVSRLADNTAAVSIGGITLGTVGTGTLAGLKLTGGDDFNTAPTWWHPSANRTGRYKTQVGRANQGSATLNPYIQHSLDSSIYLDPYYRGYNSSSINPIPFTAASVAGSVLTLTAADIPTADEPYMPPYYTPNTIGDANGHPRLSAARMWTDGYFLLGADGDFCIETMLQVESTLANGYWSGFWMCGVWWPMGSEIDVWEVANNPTDTQIRETSTVHTSLDDTALSPDWDYEFYPNHQFTALNRMVWVRLIKTGNTLTVYSDETTPGTLASKGTITDARIGTRVHRANHICAAEITCNLTSWGRNGTYNAAQWPRVYKTDWWRVWTPTSMPDHVPHRYLTDINTVPGGSWAYTIPSATALYDSVPDFEEYFFQCYNDDDPGQREYVSQSKIPGGSSINMTTRQMTGTIPTSSGGAATMFFMGTWNAGGPARVAVQVWNVAPAVQSTLFANQTLNNGTAMSITIAYVDFHSGNLGPHTYTVTKTSGTSTGLTITMGSGNNSATIAGTPTVNGAIVYDITATNALGQATTVSRTLTVATVGAVMTMDFVNNSYNYNGTVYSTWATALASGHWTFARALKAYYITSAGAVTEWATGQLRSGSGGFRCEPARTQWGRQSMECNIGNGPSFATGVTSAINNQSSPMSTTTADTLTTTTAASQHYVGQNRGIPLSSGGTGFNYNAGVVCEQSLFIKKGTQRYIQIHPPLSTSPTGLPYMNCDFDTGATSVGGTGVIASQFRSLGSGWYWMGIIYAPEATVDNGALQWAFVQDMSATRNPTWTPASATTVYTWEMMHAVCPESKFTLPVNNPNNDANGGTTRPADDLGIVLPAGTWNLRVTFMDNTTQLFTSVSGTYHLPAASLNQYDIKTIVME